MDHTLPSSSEFRLIDQSKAAHALNIPTFLEGLWYLLSSTLPLEVVGFVTSAFLIFQGGVGQDHALGTAGIGTSSLGYGSASNAQSQQFAQQTNAGQGWFSH